MDSDKKSFVEQTESYEHLEEVKTHVMDMRVRHEETKSVEFT